MSLSDVGEELGIPASDVHRLISNRFKEDAARQTPEERATILNMENDRLDFYLSKLWPSIEYGDVKAITAALSIHDRKMKANQLDRPDASLNRATILVVGGQEADYIAKLKELASG